MIYTDAMVAVYLLIAILYVFAVMLVSVSAARALVHRRFAEMTCYVLACISMAVVGAVLVHVLIL